MYTPRVVTTAATLANYDFEATNLAPGVGMLIISGSATAGNNATHFIIVDADGTIVKGGAALTNITLSLVAGAVPTTYPGVGTNTVLRVAVAAAENNACTVYFCSLQPRSK